MPSPMVSLRASGPLAEHLSSRGDSLSAVALRDLNRYYGALAEAAKSACLTEGEWSFLRDILDGYDLDEWCARYLWAKVEDAEARAAEKWGINQKSLARRLRELPVFSRLAIVDAIDQWWRAQSQEQPL